MEFSVGQKIMVDGDLYDVIGKILYRNPADNAGWTEYRLVQNQTNDEFWLSCDDVYQEYSISRPVEGISKAAYHEVDRGVMEVVSFSGNVDVDVGEKGTFIEYEDEDEEKIISTEVWEYEEELSYGYYLDADEFGPYIPGGDNTGPNGYATTNRQTGPKPISFLPILIVMLLLPSLVSFLFGSCMEAMDRHPSLKEFMENNGQFTYVTSITGKEDQKADVYKSSASFDSTVRSLLDAIEGDTQDVQQNTEDGDQSVAILTDDEYCLVYEAEDNPEDILVQVSSRQFNYYNDEQPYRSSRYTHRYYRTHYFSMAFVVDQNRYHHKSSPYDHYDGGQLVYNPADQYYTYSNSVRQSSLSSRASAGGGTGFGK